MASMQIDLNDSIPEHLVVGPAPAAAYVYKPMKDFVLVAIPMREPFGNDEWERFPLHAEKRPNIDTRSFNGVGSLEEAHGSQSSDDRFIGGCVRERNNLEVLNKLLDVNDRAAGFRVKRPELGAEQSVRLSKAEELAARMTFSQRMFRVLGAAAALAVQLDSMSCFSGDNDAVYMVAQFFAVGQYTYISEQIRRLAYHRAAPEAATLHPHRRHRSLLCRHPCWVMPVELAS